MSTYVWAARRARAADVGRAGRDVAIGAVVAAAVGLLIGKDPFYAVLPVASLVAIWLAVRPRAAAVLLGLSIPAVETVASGHIGLHIGAGDLILLVLVLAALGAAVIERDAATFKALRTVRLPALQYCVFVLILLVAHPGTQPVLQTFQRYELIAFPLIAGSYLVLRGAHMPVLKAYIVGATALALVFPSDSLGLQKNPVGQFIANAILLIVGVPRLSRYRIAVPLLVYGMFATQSRGAIVACAGGIAILLAFRWMHSPRQAIATGLAIVAVGGLSFTLLPPSAQAFITTYGSTGNSHAAWNIRFRQEYNRDALVIIRAHPWLGVGVGAYGDASTRAGFGGVPDPHNVFLLEAAEGGWLFAGSFVLLIVGTGIVLVRLRRAELAPVALAVVFATAAHGMVDIYWVRGTPVLGWLLVGMVGALAWRSREAARQT
ncbi:MAG TPA: O-antigen ligase family protein [Gaiellaceae bacterium]|nr:O-antigen ligase family protein [Gaiellaceae bacterium]